VTTRLGLRENLPQFALLVLINAFVGGMVGLERTVLPLLGEQAFGLSSKTAITSFIVSFGITKAVLNLIAARLSERVGRKPLLVTGWLFALPVPTIGSLPGAFHHHTGSAFFPGTARRVTAMVVARRLGSAITPSALSSEIHLAFTFMTSASRSTTGVRLQ